MNVESVESLESRTFLSASPSAIFNRTVTIDRLEVRVDLLKFKADALLGTAKLLVDTATIKKSIPAGDSSLTASIAQLKTDSKTLGTTLKIDRLNESSAALADESVIKLDLAQIIKDRHDATALTTDRAKLATDRAQLQSALIAGLDQRIADRTAAEATISTDTQAIVTAAGADAQATPALTSAVTKFATDRTARLATLTTDLSAIASARTKLAADLSAEANT